MRPPAARLLSPCLALALVLGAAPWARARARDASFQDARLEQGLKLLEQGRYVRVREMADEMLRKQPDSPPGHYLLGVVYYKGEGNLPRAYHELALARQLLEQRWGERVPPTGPVELHKKILYELILVCNSLERYRQELRLLDVYDRLYTPSLAALYGWPLMKLGRVKQARQKMEQVLAGTDDYMRPWVLTTLGNIEFEAFNLQKAYDDYLKVLGEVRADERPLDPVYFVNLGEAARDLLHFDDARAYLREGTSVFRAGSLGNPWRSLAEMQAGAGQFRQAAHSVAGMFRWQDRSPPQVLQQKWAQNLTAAAQVLDAMGYPRAALSTLRRVLSRPDRNAGTSSDADAVQARTQILYQSLLRLVSQQEQEQAAWKPAASSVWARLVLWAEGQTAASRAAALIVRRRDLARVLRPYGPGTLDCPWLLPCVRNVMGAGAVAVGAARLLARKGPVAAREAPYLKALVGEDDLRRGELNRAEALLDESLATLPAPEVLLRARVQALLGECSLRKGRTLEGLRLLLTALGHDPSVTRRLEFALPITGAPAIVRQLARSPRFVAASKGLDVRAEGKSVSLSLRGHPVATVSEASPRAVARAMHRKLFGPALRVGPAELRALEGAVGSGTNSRTRYRGLIR